MSMPKHDLSSRHFHRKISEFCEVHIAPMPSKRVLENLRPYLISLIMYGKRPPILNGHLDWTAIGEACGVEDEMTAQLRKQLRPTGFLPGAHLRNGSCAKADQPISGSVIRGDCRSEHTAAIRCADLKAPLRKVDRKNVDCCHVYLSSASATMALSRHHTPMPAGGGIHPISSEGLLSVFGQGRVRDWNDGAELP